MIYITITNIAPLIYKYRNDNDYSDAVEKDIEIELKWIDSTLYVSKDLWKIVIGHHLVFADTEKAESERTDMQKRIGTLFCNPDPGFTVCSVTKKNFTFSFINHKGVTIYNYIIKK